MDEKAEIKKLQEELQQLYNQHILLDQKIMDLHRRLVQLSGPVDSKAKHTLPAGKPQQPLTWENFIGLRLIHVIGIIVLVIGLSISVKYAIDRNLISEGLRISLAYGAGGVLFFLAWQLKRKYLLFSAILFSGAMASFYFTTYAAFVYYAMLPPAVTFILMVLLTILTVYQAMVYNRQEIAILGLVGAYAIPFLISTNAERADLFFTYIAIINTAVIFLSYKQNWKTVSLLAQTLTWVILIGWAMTRYETPQRWIGVLSAGYFFALFSAGVVAKKWVQQQPLAIREVQQVILNNVALYCTALLLFVPLFAAAQIGAVSIFFSLFIALQAIGVYHFLPAETYLKKMLALFSIVLLLVYIANQWDGITVTLLWLIVAVALFGWGAVGKTVWLRMAGMVLMGVTLLKLVMFDSLRFTPVQKIISYLTLGVLLLLVGFFYQKFREKLFGGSE